MKMTMTLILLVLVSGFFSGCGDKSLQDYKDEQLKQDLGKLPQKTTYTGTLSRKNDHSILGALRITHSPEVVSKTSSDNSRSSGQAVLRIVIEFQWTKNVQFTIPDAAYTPDQSEINATFPLTIGSGSSAAQEQMTFRAQIHGDHLVGSLTAVNSPDALTEFNLAKDGPPLKDQLRGVKGFEFLDQPGSNHSSMVTTYSGATEYDGVSGRKSLPVNLVVTDPEGTPNEEFLKLYTPVSTVSMTVTYAGDLKYTIQKVQLNRRDKTLTGVIESATTSGAGTSDATGLTIQCTFFDLSQLNCKYLSLGDAQIAESHFTQGPFTNLQRPDTGDDHSYLSAQFKGETIFPADSGKKNLAVNLVILDPSGSPTEEFAKLLSPVVQVSLSLNYGGNLILNFPKVQWDQRSGRMTGTTDGGSDNSANTNSGSGGSTGSSSTSNSSATKLGLDCIWSDRDHLSCKYFTNSDGVVAKSVFTRGAIANLQDPFGTNSSSINCSVIGTHIFPAPVLSRTSARTSPPVPAPKPKTARLNIKIPSHSSLDELMDRFFPARVKSAIVNFDVFNSTNSIVPFNQAKYDSNLHALDASYSSPITGALLSLRCANFPNPVVGGPIPSIFNCDYTADPGISRTIKFDPSTWKCN